MKRLTLSIFAVWHEWRALCLMRRAILLTDAAEAHAAQADMNLAVCRSLARAPLPSEDSGAGEPRGSDPSPTGGCSTAEQALLAAIIGLFIAGLWIWISARGLR